MLLASRVFGLSYDVIVLHSEVTAGVHSFDLSDNSGHQNNPFV